MNYLTAVEIAEKWNITNRMVTYYCQTGRIKGAVKKGKTWFVPVGAKKPFDKRRAKSKMHVEDNTALQGTLTSINQADTENYSAIYHSNDLYKNLGLTRETLRYFEEIGLISPDRSKESRYREFTFADVSHLMSIDFYKKRGFSSLEIRALMSSGGRTENIDILLGKINKIKKTISAQQRALERLEKSVEFYLHADEEDGKFRIREMPLYAVDETFDAVSSLGEYQEKVVQYLNLQYEDILSNMVRAVTFDETGYKGSAVCMVRKVEEDSKQKGKSYLESGKCLYTVINADSQDDSIMEKMFFACHEWANAQGVTLKGMVYIFIRFVTLEVKGDHNYYEIWLPIDF